MLILHGQLVGCYKTPEGKNDKGEEYGGDYRLEVMRRNMLRNGEITHEVAEIKTDNEQHWRSKVGHPVEVPVAMTNFKGKIYFKSLSADEMKLLRYS